MSLVETMTDDEEMSLDETMTDDEEISLGEKMTDEMTRDEEVRVVVMATNMKMTQSDEEIEWSSETTVLMEFGTW